MVWSRLIRFVSDTGETTFGDPILDGHDLIKLLDKQQLYATRLDGQDPFALERTDEKVKVIRLLGVLTQDNVPVFRCIGLNYVKHSNVASIALTWKMRNPCFGCQLTECEYSHRKWAQTSSVSLYVYEAESCDCGIQ